MSNGATNSDWLNFSTGRNNIYVQEKLNNWESWIRRSHFKYTDNSSGYDSNYDTDDQNIPFPNSLERSLLKRGPSRRKYKIRVLETRYPYKIQQDATKLTQPVERKRKNAGSKSTRFILGNKSFTNACLTIAEKKIDAKRVCKYNRSAFDDTFCCRLFQAVGSDLIAPWLTPEEVYNVENVFNCTIDWGQAWHGGKVKDKETAAIIQFLLQNKVSEKTILQKFNHDFVFSAFWYLIDPGLFVQLCYQYSHYRSIRKVNYFN